MPRRAGRRRRLQQPPEEDPLARQDRSFESRRAPTTWLRWTRRTTELWRRADAGPVIVSMLRKAGKRRRSLYLMNDILAKAQPEHKERIRQQLRAEYGVDPLGGNAPVGLEIGSGCALVRRRHGLTRNAMRAGNIDDALQAEMVRRRQAAARKAPVKPGARGGAAAQRRETVAAPAAAPAEPRPRPPPPALPPPLPCCIKAATPGP